MSGGSRSGANSCSQHFLEHPFAVVAKKIKAEAAAAFAAIPSASNVAPPAALANDLTMTPSTILALPTVATTVTVIQLKAAEKRLVKPAS